jgi:acyl carrier protein phosphodiesterase
MNLLGHLYFSNDDTELMYANLFGDYVKGSDLDQYPPKVKQGLILHRQIDQFIDHHPDVVVLMRSLYAELPKVTGIAIDLFFDHLLARNWTEFHPGSLDDFLNKFYQYNPKYFDGYSPEFQEFVVQLKMNKWISHYPTRFGLEKMSEGVSRRISFPNSLHTAPVVFDQHEEAITICFQSFMQDARQHFSRP